MAKKGRGRKIKTAEQVRAEAEQRKRDKLTSMGAETGGGVPEHQVEGAKVYNFEEHGKTIRQLYPSIVDRWFAEARLSGDPGFQEPQKRAVEHVRGLWKLMGSPRLVANYGGTIGGGGDGESAHFAMIQLAEYQKDIPVSYWLAFENVVRFDMPAGRAGSHLARTSAQQQAHAKAATGMCLSLIAMWRGY